MIICSVLECNHVSVRLWFTVFGNLYGILLAFHETCVGLPICQGSVLVVPEAARRKPFVVQIHFYCKIDIHVFHPMFNTLNQRYRESHK